MAAEGGNIVRYTYRGGENEVIPDEATHILVQARVVREGAFFRHRNIVEVICHEGVEKIEADAFSYCPSIWRVIMPGVKVIEIGAFYMCNTLAEVACDKLEIIGYGAFCNCDSLRSISLPSARIIQEEAFSACYALTNIKFGSNLEKIEERAFCLCDSLERITIPLKDGLIAADNAFQQCRNLKRVYLIEEEAHGTIAALQLDEWRNDMNEKIDSINQILPNAAAGSRWADGDEEFYDDDDYQGDPGEKAQAIRRWIRLVLDKMFRYKDKHSRLLSEAATTLELALPNNDIVTNDVLPFLQLPYVQL